MSGPKTSVLSANFMSYSALSEGQKAAWAEAEILVNLRSMAAYEKQIELLIPKIEYYQDIVHPDSYISELIETARECMTATFDDIDPHKKFDKNELDNLRNNKLENNISWYRVQTQSNVDLKGKYLEYFQSIRDRSLDEKVSIARGCATKAAKMKAQVRKLKLALRDLEEAAKAEVIMEGVKTSFYIPFKSIQNRSGAETLIKKINEELGTLTKKILTDSMLDQLQVLKNKAAEIRDASYLGNFYQVVVRPFVQECTAYDAFYNTHFAEYEEYKTSYEILCKELDLMPQVMEISEEAIAFYKSKTEELQDILLKRRTREMVMETIDEVMAEMGYDLVASRDVTKKSGKQYHDELFLYGDGTAISVVQSSEGQITMEIGGLDYGDRMPTSQEAQEMSTQMASFCVDYDKITEALKEHGLDMKQVSRLPADPQYATIINLDEYDLRVSVQTITEAKKTKEQTETQKKERHAED